MVASSSNEKAEGLAARTNRVERFFTLIGVTVVGLCFVALVIGIDLALTEETGPLVLNSPEDAITLVTASGRELGRPMAGKVRLVHTPLTLFENLPSQDLGSIQINSIGLRAPEILPTPDRPRIVVVGGSAAFGLGVGGPGTLPSALGRLLSDSEVLNAGVVGYHSSQELALVVHKLLDLQPSLILAFNGWNDLFEAIWWERFGHSDGERHNVDVMFNDLETRLLIYREIEWSASYALQQAGLSIVRNSTLLSAAYRGVARGEAPPPRSVPESRHAETIAWTAENYVSNMKKMHHFARSTGARLLVVLQPEEGQLISFAEQQARSREGGEVLAGTLVLVDLPGQLSQVPQPRGSGA